jgi:hypothetical protein
MTEAVYAAHPSRLAEDGERLRMMVERVVKS